MVGNHVGLGLYGHLDGIKYSDCLGDDDDALLIMVY